MRFTFRKQASRIKDTFLTAEGDKPVLAVFSLTTKNPFGLRPTCKSASQSFNGNRNNRLENAVKFP